MHARLDCLDKRDHVTLDAGLVIRMLFNAVNHAGCHVVRPDETIGTIQPLLQVL